MFWTWCLKGGSLTGDDEEGDGDNGNSTLEVENKFDD